MTLFKMRLWRCLVAALFAVTHELPSAEATDWSNIAPGDLTLGSNWLGGVAPQGIDAVARIGVSPQFVPFAPGNFSISSPLILGRLEYQNNLTPRSIVGAPLTMRGAGNAQIVQSGAPTVLAMGRLILDSTTEFSPTQLSDSISVQSPITGGGGLIKTGNGTVLLSNATNDYAGLNTLMQGIIEGAAIANAGVASSYGLGSFAISNDATLRYTGGTASTDRTVTLGAGGGRIDVSNATSNLTFSGIVSGDAPLAKDGSGTLLLSAANSFGSASNPLVINNGIVSGSTMADVGVDSNFGRGNVQINNNATLRYTGTSASTDRIVTLGSGGGTIDVANPSAILDFTSYNALPTDGQFNKSGPGTLFLSNTAQYLNSTIQVLDGTLQFNVNAYFGNTAHGQCYVIGGNSALQAAQVSVGEGAAGDLFVSDGGHVETQWLIIHHAAGPNAQAVFDGGSASITSGVLIVGQQTGGEGLLELKGGSQVASNNQLQVGASNGAGKVFVREGSTLTTAKGTSSPTLSGTIGFTAGTTGLVVVSGNGSRWTQDGGVNVGSAGNGTLEIHEGGAADATFIRVARAVGSNGQVIVDGQNSQLVVQNSLYIGGGEAGPGGTGMVSVGNDGRIEVGQSLTLIGNGQIDLTGGGSVKVGTTAATPAAETLRVATGGTLSGDGRIIGNVLNDGGAVAPGFSSGTLRITGSFTQASGTLGIEIAGTGNGQFDTLDVTGNLQLGGALQILLTNFAPAIGNSFDLLDWTGSLAGAFSTLQLPPLPTGSIWNTSQLYIDGVLSVVAAYPGDFDSDGDVDGADFEAWQMHFQTVSGGTLATGDADGDGDVDGADFVAWQIHFPTPPGGGALPVPEPGTVTPAVIAAGCFTFVAYRARHCGTAKKMARVRDNTHIG